MARDGVANILKRLRERGFHPQRVAPEAWEARCPAHHGPEHALAVGRDEQNRVTLHCRSQHCDAVRIVNALDLTSERVYAETPNWVLRKLDKMPIVPPRFRSASASANTNNNERARQPDIRSPRERITAEAPREPAPEPASVDRAGPDDVPILKDPVRLDCFASVRSQNEPRSAPAGDGGATERCTPGITKEDECSGRCGDEPSSRGELLATDSNPEPALAVESDCERPDRSSPAAATGTAAGDRLGVDRLVQLAAGAEVFRVADGRLFARVRVGERQEMYGLRSTEFRRWLIDRSVAGGGRVPSRGSIRHVIEVLEARAQFDGTPTLAIRVGRNESDAGAPIFVDLGEPSGRAVAIDARGWTIVDRPGVTFRRPDGFLPLPLPSRDGSIELLRPYVNLSDRDFRLLVVWLAAALRPVGPYPVLALYGEQGSAKSTLARVVRKLVDPQAAPVLAEPKSTRDLMITALNGWLLAYDNISTIQRWMSDALCVVATGGAYAGRTEYTTLDRTIVQVQRPVILNGIDEFVRRGDLTDRAVIFHLPPISPEHRRREDELWTALEADRPRIFGGLLDAIAGGLRELPDVQFARLPRMADFAAASEAIGRSLGWGAGTVLADYEDSRREATAAQIEDSLVATVLLRSVGQLGKWTGRPSDLLAELSTAAGRSAAASARWPKSPERFTNELRRVSPQLRMHGLHLSFGRNHYGRIVSVEPSETLPIKNCDTRNSNI